MAPDDRTTLRATFDGVADDYARVRPRYPGALFDALMQTAGLTAGDRVLEIGPGPGVATRPLAARGLRVTGLELGPRLAAVARDALADLPEVRIVDGDFDTWSPPPGTPPFDLVAAATAWHWPDPETKYARAAERLRPGGHLAFWAAGHVTPPDGDGFVSELQDDYVAAGFDRLPGGRPATLDELPDLGDEIRASGCFAPIAIRRIGWEATYDADGYLGLIATFSSHIAMASAARETLFAAIRERIRARPGGEVRHAWGAILHVARRDR